METIGQFNIIIDPGDQITPEIEPTPMESTVPFGAQHMGDVLGDIPDDRSCAASGMTWDNESGQMKTDDADNR